MGNRFDALIETCLPPGPGWSRRRVLTGLAVVGGAGASAGHARAEPLAVTAAQTQPKCEGAGRIGRADWLLFAQPGAVAGSIRTSFQATESAAPPAFGDGRYQAEITCRWSDNGFAALDLVFDRQPTRRVRERGVDESCLMDGGDMEECAYDGMVDQPTTTVARFVAVEGGVPEATTGDSLSAPPGSPVSAALAAGRPVRVHIQMSDRTSTDAMVRFPDIPRAIAAARQAKLDVEAQHRDGRCYVGCFLTTACTTTVGLADDCWELRTLRRFRDGVLARTEAGRALIATYYRTAPQIVAGIDRRADARRLWLQTYWTGVLPCAVMARLGLHRAARLAYRRMTLSLQARAA